MPVAAVALELLAGMVEEFWEKGLVLERAAVNFSHTGGASLPDAATDRRPELAGARFEAVSVSLIVHPRNPYAPTTHANLRLFSATTVEGDEPDKAANIIQAKTPAIARPPRRPPAAIPTPMVTRAVPRAMAKAPTIPTMPIPICQVIISTKSAPVHGRTAMPKIRASASFSVPACST